MFAVSYYSENNETPFRLQESVTHCPASFWQSFHFWYNYSGTGHLFSRPKIIVFSNLLDYFWKRCVGPIGRFSFESKLNSSNAHFRVHLRIKQQKRPPFYKGLSKCWVQLPLLLPQVWCLLLVRLLLFLLPLQQPEPQLLIRSTVGFNRQMVCKSFLNN